MSRAGTIGKSIGTVASYWKALTVLIGGVFYLFASVTPKFGFVTKFAFGWFLVRTYWPELLAALLVIGTSLMLKSRFGWDLSNPLTDAKARARRAIATARQVTAPDQFYGAVLIAIVIFTCTPFVWKQATHMLEAEQIFVATRLMNWFGDDLHRIAAREINEGNYDTAVRTLKVQALELPNLEEGHTAASVGAHLERLMMRVEKDRKRVLERMSQTGVVRSDLLLLGVLQAMLPPHPLGHDVPTPIPGAESLQSYRAALKRIKAQCDDGTIGAATAREVGMAAAALGFARSPSFLFGRVEDIAERARMLCEIVGPRDVVGVEKLHRAAFSISAPSVRPDWRKSVSRGAVTPGAMVGGSFRQVIERAIERIGGGTPLAELLPSSENDEPPGDHLTQVLEGHSLFVVSEAPATSVNGEAFIPVTLIASAAAQSVEAYALVNRGKDGINLTLCIPSDVSAAVDGYLFKMSDDGRLHIVEADWCGQESSEAEIVRSMDESLMVAIGRIITISDSKGGMPPPKGLRGALCRVFVANVKEHAPTLGASAIELCPLDAAAKGLVLVHREHNMESTSSDWKSSLARIFHIPL